MNLFPLYIIKSKKNNSVFVFQWEENRVGYQQEAKYYIDLEMTTLPIKCKAC